MSNRERYIRQRAASLGLDPDAVVAIATHEGAAALRGGNSIGDHGTSFGPFQLHAGGALPAGKGNAWANSKAGLNYALSRMAQVAKGLQGKAAIAAISQRFERPADPASEIADAWAHYGHAGAPGGPLGSPAHGGGAAALMNSKAFSAMAAAEMLDQASATVSGHAPDASGLISLALARQQLQKQAEAHAALGPVGPKTAMTGGQTAGGVKFVGDIRGEQPAFLHKLGAAAASIGATQIRVTSGRRSPQSNAAAGGVSHSNHLTGDAMDGEAFIPGHGWVPLGVALQGVAGQFGLRSGNVPGFFNGNPDPVHVDDGANQR